MDFNSSAESVWIEYICFPQCRGQKSCVAKVLVVHNINSERDRFLDFRPEYSEMWLIEGPSSELTFGINMYWKQSGNDIEDEDLIKGEDFEKYILIRGRAGIGKSTLVQRLIWKWANGEWRTNYRPFSC